MTSGCFFVLAEYGRVDDCENHRISTQVASNFDSDRRIAEHRRRRLPVIKLDQNRQVTKDIQGLA